MPCFQSHNVKDPQTLFQPQLAGKEDYCNLRSGTNLVSEEIPGSNIEILEYFNVHFFGVVGSGVHFEIIRINNLKR